MPNGDWLNSSSQRVAASVGAATDSVSESASAAAPPRHRNNGSDSGSDGDGDVDRDGEGDVVPHAETVEVWRPLFRATGPPEQESAPVSKLASTGAGAAAAAAAASVINYKNFRKAFYAGSTRRGGVRAAVFVELKPDKGYATKERVAWFDDQVHQHAIEEKEKAADNALMSDVFNDTVRRTGKSTSRAKRGGGRPR
jgi:hypothetical protein